MEFLFGTAGWSYKDWFGTVYPKNPDRSFNYLGFIAEKFDFVEVNTTFYRTPSVELTQGWIDKTLKYPDFKFWVKLNSVFSHTRNYSKQEVTNFIDSIRPIYDSGKLEGLLLQFPYSFKFGVQTMKYLEELYGYFGIFTLSVEFRHKSWNNPELLNFLSQYGIIWVNIDQPVISHSLPLTSKITSEEMTYFRLHGRNYKNWFSQSGRDARYDYNYSSTELIKIGESISETSKKVKKVFISGNNHYKGNAVKNLKELDKILSEISG